MDALRLMDLLGIFWEGYISVYTRIDLTNYLYGSAGFSTDKEIVIKQWMCSIVAQIRKREKTW